MYKYFHCSLFTRHEKNLNQISQRKKVVTKGWSKHTLRPKRHINKMTGPVTPCVPAAPAWIPLHFHTYCSLLTDPPPQLSPYGHSAFTVVFQHHIFKWHFPQLLRESLFPSIPPPHFIVILAKMFASLTLGSRKCLIHPCVAHVTMVMNTQAFGGRCCCVCMCACVRARARVCVVCRDGGCYMMSSGSVLDFNKWSKLSPLCGSH